MWHVHLSPIPGIKGEGRFARPCTPGIYCGKGNLKAPQRLRSTVIQQWVVGRTGLGCTLTTSLTRFGGGVLLFFVSLVKTDAAQ